MWANSGARLRTEAARRLEHEWLVRWWCKKYNRPRKDPLIVEYTLEELFIEFMEDKIEENPGEAFPPVDEDGVIAFARTGDAKIDAWEKKLADGKDLTMDDFDSPEVRKWLAPKAKPKKAVVAKEHPPDRPKLDLDDLEKLMEDVEKGIADDFGGNRG